MSDLTDCREQVIRDLRAIGVDPDPWVYLIDLLCGLKADAVTIRLSILIAVIQAMARIDPLLDNALKSSPALLERLKSALMGQRGGQPMAWKEMLRKLKGLFGELSPVEIIFAYAYFLIGYMPDQICDVIDELRAEMAPPYKPRPRR